MLTTDNILKMKKVCITYGRPSSSLLISWPRIPFLFSFKAQLILIFEFTLKRSKEG